MNNFITLLDTTLHMNREDDKSDDEEDKKEPVPPAHDIHRSASLPSKSGCKEPETFLCMTLCSTI